MRLLFALAVCAGLAAPAAAQEPKKVEPPKKPEATLKVGDPAPPVKATKWLQGAEVKELAAGRVYVVEFWATWCGPCIVMMPHMADLQAQYKDKGVTFVGYTAKDPNNTQEKVTAFVEKRGPKLGYTFAYADDRETYNAWMQAAGQNGIPCCFVVGKDGKIAFIGHPMYLDAVLPKVVAGKFTEADAEAVKGIEKEVNAVFQASGKEPEAFLSTLAEFQQKHPELAGIPYFYGPKLVAMIKTKQTAEVKKLSETLIAKGVKTEDPTLLGSVAGALSTAKDSPELLAVAVKAAEGGVKLAGEKDAFAVFRLAEAYFAAGDKAKAKATGEKAVAAADNEGLKKYLQKQTEKYSDEKKDEKNK